MDAPTALAAVTGVLVAHNLVGNLLVPPAWYIPANLLTTGALLALAGGIRFGPIRDGLVAGLPVAALLGLGFWVVVHSPRFRPLLADRRMVGVDFAGAMYRAFVRIPFGTVVLEEVAFRGVLLALLMDVTSTGWAVAVSSSLFGLWHVLPTRAALAINGVERDRWTGAVAGAVAVTAGVAVGFCWLRLVSGSLVAPMIVHAAANSGATLAAHAVLVDRR